MGFEAVPEPSSTPKISYFSLPSQEPEPPGMLTPPLRPPSSIPFFWEEAPGKPRNTTTNITTNTTTFSKPSSARCLELPPRLLSEVKSTNMPSPSTVLDGPYIARSVSHSAVFARERLASFQELGSISKRRESKEKGYFAAWGRKSTKRSTRVCEDSCAISSCPSSLGGAGDSEDITKVKITRFRRTGSLFNLSSSSRPHSHLWASIYGTFKQVVPRPWRSRKTRKDGFSF
ncbi:hypothetical protein IFM89_028273 [Coptis chinensis]|uniref:Uncharacterized protein n=1 Tax=Coptis chinensis TaxID=261450 RepID=A0A835HFU9_9MAGN|nr:hypothetical protein IFM89_028273 [Coptis chinensis]